jgi:uncharacterized protein YacL
MKKNIYIYGGVALVWVGYLLLTFFTPHASSPLTEQLSTTQIFLLRFSIVAPYLFIWLIGCYGGLALYAYAHSVEESDNRNALTHIAIGIFTLIGGLLTTTLLGSLRQIFQVTQPELVSTMVVVINYAYILIPLVALYFVFSGARKLAFGVRAEKLGASAIMSSLCAFAVVALYTWLVFTNMNREVSVSAEIPATYFLSDPMIIMTIILPFLASLLFGFFSLSYLAQYMKNVTGVVYKAAATRFITGIFLVILAGIILQILQSLGSARLLGLGLGLILLIIYFFMAVQAGGYIFIALGAKKLTAVEQLLGKYRTEKEDTSL